MVIASLIDTDGKLDTAEQIALTSSNDGGLTFTKSTLANDPIRQFILTGHDDCGQGIQDFPSVTFDQTTSPPTGYAVWRNKLHSSFGGCIQAFTLDDTGSFSLLGPAHGIDNMDRQHGGSNEGQGYLKVVASDGIVTVVYSNDDSLDSNACPGGTTPTSIAWGAVSSFDSGASWSDHSHVFESESFVWCGLGGTIQRGLKEFDAAIGPDGNLFVIVSSAEGEARLFMSSTRGIERHNTAAWRELCPGSQPIVGGPTSEWTAPGLTCNAGRFRAGTILRPTLGFDTNARLVVGFYHERQSSSSQIEWVVQAVTAPRAAISGLADFQDERVPDIAFSVSTMKPLGYMPNNPTDPFLDISSANDLGWQNAIVAAGPTEPFPQGNRKVFAFWTQGDDVPLVESARVDFTPAQ